MAYDLHYRISQKDLAVYRYKQNRKPKSEYFDSEEPMMKGNVHVFSIK